MQTLGDLVKCWILGIVLALVMLAVWWGIAAVIYHLEPPPPIVSLVFGVIYPCFHELRHLARRVGSNGRKRM